MHEDDCVCMQCHDGLSAWDALWQAGLAEIADHEVIEEWPRRKKTETSTEM